MNNLLLIVTLILLGCGTAEDGLDGRDGTNGRNGVNGSKGSRGIPGEPGSVGEQGPEGEPGRDALSYLDVMVRFPYLTNVVFLPSARTVAIPQLIYSYPLESRVTIQLGESECSYEDGQFVESLSGEQPGDIVEITHVSISIDECQQSYCYATARLYVE
jgi:hypothetical protein